MYNTKIRPGCAFLNDFEPGVFHHAVRPVPLNPLFYCLQGPLDLDPIRIDQRTGNDRLLPHILPVHLRHRDVELAVQAVKQRLEPPALFLQGCAAGQVQVDSEDADHFNSFDIRHYAAQLQV